MRKVILYIFLLTISFLLSGCNNRNTIESINLDKSCSKYWISEINSFKNSNIISVAKYFQGHGDTDIDSHYALPIINKNLEELKEL